MATETNSPANGATRVSDRKRIPMSVPRQKLAAPEIPGYHLHWMKGTPDRLQQAEQGGYEFVDASETAVSNVSLGGDASRSGSTDLGTRVSVLAGDEVGPDGQPIRLYLMKIREEWHQEDLLAQGEHSERLRATLMAGKMGAEQDKNASDTSARYVGQQTTHNMFVPKPIRRV